MSTRSLLSGSSLLRPLRASAPLPLPASRRHITFPHPALEAPDSTTRITIRTSRRIPSLAHAYTILRAVERKLNTTAIFIQMPKNPDTLSPTMLFFIETATPVKIPDEMMLEIPAPKMSAESNFLGGPSLEDVRAALAIAPDARTSDAPLLMPKPNDSLAPLPPRRDDAGEAGVDVMQIQVSASREKRVVYRDPKVWRLRNRQGGGDIVNILEALQAFDGGFFGGFAGIVDESRLERRNDKFHNLDKGNGGKGARQKGWYGRKDNDRT